MELEAVHPGGDCDAALPKFHSKSVFLFGVDVELAELLRDLDAHEFIASGRADPQANQLAASRRPLQFFVDLALDDVFVATQAVAVFEQFIDAQLGDLTKGDRLFSDEGFPGDNCDDDGGDGTDDDSGVKM